MSQVRARALARSLLRPARKPDATLLGACGAVCLGATGAEHLDLYLTGYGSVPTIGPLFLLQSVTALVLAVAVIASRLPLLAVAGGLFALSTLGGYLLSVEVGLFGFHEVRSTAGITAGVLEVVAFVALSIGAVLSLDGLPRRLTAAASAPVAVAGLVVLSLASGHAASQTGTSEGSSAASVIAITVPRYGEVLATPARDSLYLLSDERPGHVTCTGGCLSLWPPLLAAKGSTTLLAAAGVRGKLGLLRRGSSQQLTYNGYPLYTYVGDAGPAGSAGQDIVSNGGTWYLVRAAARTRAATAVNSAS
jgi:predicted lipoprotein with Yx(FWY)xxD motif